MLANERSEWENIIVAGAVPEAVALKIKNIIFLICTLQMVIGLRIVQICASSVLLLV